MNETKSIKGTSLEDAFQQLTTDLTWVESPNNYRATIHTGKHDIFLETVRSPGGGDEGWGFEQTTLRAALPSSSNFRFAIVPEDFFNKIGKVFGLQDVKIGFPEFDDNVLVQTNDEEKLKTIFADSNIRQIFPNLSGYSFHIDKHDDAEGDHLHFVIQHALTHPQDLRRIIEVFDYVLTSLH